MLLAVLAQVVCPWPAAIRRRMCGNARGLCKTARKHGELKPIHICNRPHFHPKWRFPIGIQVASTCRIPRLSGEVRFSVRPGLANEK
jgi:hypothetical protein